MVRVDIFPFDGGNNPYLNIIKSFIIENGFELGEFLYSERYYIINKNNTRFVYLNWFENIEEKSNVRTIIRAIRRIAFLLLLRIRNIKIIAVIHNRMPHDCKHRMITKWFIKRYYLLADRLVVLNKYTQNVLYEDYGRKFLNKVVDKIYTVPLPTYRGIYKDNNLNIRSHYNIKKEDFLYLFFGRIERYKNLELVIEAAKNISRKYNDVVFLIIGACNECYELELRKNIGGNEKIILINQEIDQNELLSFIKNSNIVVLPFNKKSSLNSSSCMLCMSYGKNVICPEIPALREVPSGLLYTYDYENYITHKKNLIYKCEEAYNDFINVRNFFQKKEDKIKKFANKEYSRERCKSLLLNVFMSLEVFDNEKN